MDLSQPTSVHYTRWPSGHPMVRTHHSPGDPSVVDAVCNQGRWTITIPGETSDQAPRAVLPGRQWIRQDSSRFPVHRGTRTERHHCYWGAFAQVPSPPERPVCATSDWIPCFEGPRHQNQLTNPPDRRHLRTSTFILNRGVLENGFRASCTV